MTKFVILKIRAKISFTALERAMSIKELLLVSIWKTCMTMLEERALTLTDHEATNDLTYTQIINGESNVKMVVQQY